MVKGIPRMQEIMLPEPKAGMTITLKTGKEGVVLRTSAPELERERTTAMSLDEAVRKGLVTVTEEE